MSENISKEYRMLIDKKNNIEKEMKFLPKGYISKKNIKGNMQYYLQRREGTRIVSSYINKDEVEDISSKIEKRKQNSKELQLIYKRIIDLEHAAKLINKDLLCLLMLYKLSSRMDNISKSDKEKCSSFGKAMNAIEGIEISKETNDAINSWKQGEISFLNVFENTLKRYGFPVEA
ncbi:MAG: hypothetical protein E7385_07465 [Ruminococcaceae bacterium]|nr:hypothetical protein [Oscillospiraceae bacterium]